MSEKATLLELNKISFSYDAKSVLQNFSHQFEGGKVYGVSGDSGLGKTTLCRILAGQLVAQSGDILLNGVRVHGHRSKRVILVNQENDLFPWQTVRETIDFFKGSSEKTSELLELVSLERYQDHYPKQLSGGMKKRLSLCRALSVNPSVLILDELFSSQDEALAADLFKKVAGRIRSQGHVLIIVSHDQEFLKKCCDEIFSI